MNQLRTQGQGPSEAKDLLDEARALLEQGPLPAGTERCVRGPRVAILLGSVDSDLDGVDVPVTVFVGRDPTFLDGLPVRIHHLGEDTEGNPVTWAGRLDARGLLVFRGLPDHGAYRVSVGSVALRAERAPWEPDLDLGVGNEVVLVSGEPVFNERYSNADGSVVCEVKTTPGGLVAHVTATGDGWTSHLVTVTWRFVREELQSAGTPRSLVIPLRRTTADACAGWVTLAGTGQAWDTGNRLVLQVSSVPWPRRHLADVPSDVLAASVASAGEGTMAVWREMVVDDVPASVQAEIRRWIR